MEIKIHSWRQTNNDHAFSFANFDPDNQYIDDITESWYLEERIGKPGTLWFNSGYSAPKGGDYV